MRHVAVIGLGLLLLCSGANAQTLMDAQQKQRQRYKDCQSFNATLLGERDLDADGSDEVIMLYAFEACLSKPKTGTRLVILHKAGGKWPPAPGDTVLSQSEATMYTLEDAAEGIVTLRHVLNDNVPVVRLKYTRKGVKFLK